MTDTSAVEATRELCDDLDGLIDLAKQGRVPVRAISLVERARADLEVYLNQINAAVSAVAWSGLGSRRETTAYRSRPWTHREEKRLVSLISNRRRPHEVAVNLKRGVEAVKRRAKAPGLSFKQLSR